MLAEGLQTAGTHEAAFAPTLPSGVYFYTLTAEAGGQRVFAQTKKMLLVK